MRHTIKQKEGEIMELRVLRYFLAVAREENITAAAESLHVTQPTLSKQLMDLEAQLGKTLFLRGKRKITLTEEGMFLRKRAQEIVDLADKTEAELMTSDDVVEGNIYIGAGETQGVHLIAKAIKTLHNRYPNIRYHLFSGNGEDVSERLDKGLIDFGLFVGNIESKKYDYLKYIVPKEGANFWIDSLVIPKGTKNKSAAETFINFLCEKDSAYRVAEEIGYTTPHEGAMMEQDEEVRNNPGAYMPEEIMNRCESYKYLNEEELLKYEKVWLEVKS